MKVLLVGPHLDDPGGVASYYNAVLPKLIGSDLTINYLEVGRSAHNGYWLHKITDQLKFIRLLWTNDHDIVHINPQLDFLSFVRDGVFVVLARAKKKPVLVFYHGWQLPFERLVESWFLPYFRQTYGRGQSFIVLAAHFANRLRSWGIRSPIHQTFTAVENNYLTDFSIDQKVNGILSGEPLKVLFIARLVPGKGLFEFLAGLASAIEREIDVTATIAGDGPMMAELALALEKSPALTRRVSVVGYVSGTRKIEMLRSHHVFCNPTTFPEGLQTTLMETMAFGMAAVTCHAGGIGDFFEAGQMGVMLDSPEATQIADAIQYFVDNRARLAQIALFNHEYASRRFLASDAATFLKDRYLELVSRSSADRGS